MEKTSMSDLCHMIEMFKDDQSFNRYLVICLLDKMKKGKKLEFENFIVAFLSGLQHKEYLPDLVQALVSYEQFHLENSYEIYYKILVETAEGSKLIKAI
eukprot:CAMPEP_0170471786 /NCGR_PEP_ID=MMETSP0123-20130129/13951_1 /TAXON_ID=182087 /ORGANISM="Favella ehrenbergii, Strain Fehren 1" /LENGTH=98 /DNA_ID=CAMNT_0010739673 /DNA_START=233 /DNA_END=529 /DNA_ORIENTATION=-